MRWYLQLRIGGEKKKKKFVKKLYTFDPSFKRTLGDAITRLKMFKMKSVTFGVNTQLPTFAETYLIAREFLTVVCWDDTPCRWINRARRFEGPYRLHLQVQAVQEFTLLGLLDHEDKGTTILSRIGEQFTKPYK